jgi:protein-tyrosine-phosphatase
MTGDSKPLRVLFLCTGNSARSQMAEALLKQLSKDRVEVFSAGSAPQPQVHPLAKETLEYRYGIETSDLVPKSMDRFLGEPFDYVITVCDRARATCPVFPGGSVTLHWGVDDPAEATGTDQERQQAFDRALKELSVRVHTFLPLVMNRRS